MSKLLKSKILLGVFALVLTVAVAGSALAADGAITKTLKKGMKDVQVKYLQQTLNEKGYTVAATGAGSVGKESTYFGPATVKAVKAFQKAMALTVDGVFGKLSRTALDGSVVTNPSDLCPNGNTVASSCQVAPGGTASGPLCPNGMTVASNCQSGVVVPPVSGQVSVALSQDNPAAGNVVAGQAIADLAHFTFSNGTAAAVPVTSVKLTRNGYSVDADLSNVYLYNGNVRVTDSATVSAGVITFNDSTGLFSIPANSSMTIAVKADILSTFGGTVGVSMTSFTAGTTAMPVVVAGNLMYGITVTVTAVDFPSQTIQPTSTSASPSTDNTVWSANVSIGTNDVLMKSFRLRQIGSVTNADIQNFKLFVSGVQAGSTVASLGADGYVTFDLSAAPVTLKSGTRTLKVVADIIGGSSRTFSFSLRAASDLNIVDTQVGVNPLVTYNSVSFTPLSSTSATIDSGSLTFSKATDSPSSTLVLGGSNVLLGKWDVKAYGEQMKVENLYVRVIPSVAGTTALRNGKFFYNDVQIGSTAAVSTAAAGTQYTFGSAFVVTPGTPGVLTFYADNYASTGTAIVAGDTFQAEVCNAACNASQTGLNVQRKISLTYASYPVSQSLANTLTAAVGTFTMAKDQSYGNQTIVVPKTALLLGQFTLTSGSSDVVNADTITVTINSATTNGSTDITSLYVVYGAKTTNTKSSITTAASGVDSVNTWSIGETIPANTTLSFKVYGDVASGASANTITTKLLVSGTSSSSSAVTTGTVTGQVMTPASSGVLTVSLDSGTPTSAQVVAGATDPAGSLKVKLAGTNEDQYVKSLTVHVNSVANSAAIASLNLSSSTTSTGTYTTVGSDQTLTSDGTIPGYATWTLTGSNRIAVAKNGSVYLKVTPTYVSSGQAAVSGLTPVLALTDLQAEGTAVLSASGTGATLINASGIVVKANNSATYVNSTETHTAAIISASTTTIPTANGIAFTPGDVIFIDGNADSTWDPATEELMVVLLDGGVNLTVKRGAFGTTAVAYDVDTDPIYRLSGLVATYTNGGIIGNAMTVLNTKLSLALAGNSPSGATSAGTSKIVFSFVASAANNSADVATNTATLTYVDITTTESSASISNLKLYPSDYDTNDTYVTTCGALTASKWRCTLSSTANTNQIDENSSRTYVVRGDTAYSTNGSIDISIAALGTSSVSTNSVYWTDGSSTQYWVNQSSTYVQNASPLSSTVASGTVDATGPSIASMVFGGTADNALDVADTIVVTWSEPIDPTTIAATLVPGGAAVAITDGATGDLAVAVTTGVLTATNIFTTDIDAGDPGAATYANTVTLDATSKILTFTITAVSTGSAALAGPETFTDVTGLTTTVKDANAVVQADSAVTPTGNI